MIAQRYLARTFAAHAAAAAAILLLLYLAFDLVEVYRLLDASGGGLGAALSYLGDRCAGALWHVLPAAALFGVTGALGSLARRGEITALHAGGLRPAALLTPLLLVAAAAAGITFAVSEWWMPQANRRIHERLAPVLDSGPAKRKDHWLRAGGRFVRLGRLGPRVDEAREVTVFELDRSFGVTRRIDAERMRWREGGWSLEGVAVRELARPGSVERRGRLPLPLDVPPDRLRAGAAPVEALTAAELADLAAWKRREGHDASALEGAVAERWSWALLPMLLVMVAAPLGLSPRRGGGLWASLGRALVIAAIFAALAFAARALSRAGVLSPAAAAWIPVALLGTCGVAICAVLVWPRRAR